MDGRVVLTPFVLPGESARVEVRSESPKLLRAGVTELTEASAERVEAMCPHFGRCGGCHYQHAGYAYQLQQKEIILREVLRRVGKIDIEEIQTVAGPPLEYRNRVQLHASDGYIGFHEPSSHNLCPVRLCPVASPHIQQAIAALRRMVRQPRFPAMLRSLELFTNEQRMQINVRATDGRRIARTFFEWCAGQIPGADATTVDYPAAGERFRVSPRSFFQVNRFLVNRLVDLALEAAEGDSAVDLYSGVGLFSIPLARRIAAVTAVESSHSASDDLEHNAQRAGLPVTLRRNTAELFLDTLTTPPDFVLADPPRTGIGKGVTKQLLRLKPPRITIVSCDPATGARDLAALLAGGYRIDDMTLIDLFPQTYHIETVTRLTVG